MRVRPTNLTLSRSGGNRMTAYNWETNASNAGADFRIENDTFLGGGARPNGAVAPGLEAARNAGAGMLVTMPTDRPRERRQMVPTRRRDVSGPNYLATYGFPEFAAQRPAVRADAGSRPIDFVYQDEYVNFLDKTYAGAFASTERIQS